MTIQSNSYPPISEQLQNKTIVFIALKINGLGDISCSLKCAGLVKNLLGPDTNILIASKSLDDIVLFNEKHQFEVIDPDDIATVHNVALQIIVPTNNCDVRSFLSNGIPTLGLYEYDYSKAKHDCNWLHTESLGLGEDCMGIFIDEELRTWGFSDEANTPIRRLEKLLEASEPVYEEILGDRSPEEYVENNLLYFGYAHNTVTITDYLKAIAMLNVRGSNNITVWTPTRLTLSPDLKEKLTRCGFGQVILNSNTVEVGDTERTFTIISKRVDHHDFKTLLMASEKETIITGDQSLGEAISCNKHFINEMLQHKTTLGQHLSSRYFHRYVHLTINYPVGGYESSNPMLIFNSFRQQRELSEVVQSVNASICEERNIQITLPAVIAHTLEICKKEEIIDLTGEKEFAKMIPFDQTVKISVQQIVELEIKADTNHSPYFPNSYFEYKSLSMFYYLVTRKHS
jgi:hypothetical protein